MKKWYKLPKDLCSTRLIFFKRRDRGFKKPLTLKQFLLEAYEEIMSKLFLIECRRDTPHFTEKDQYDIDSLNEQLSLIREAIEICISRRKF